MEPVCNFKNINRAQFIHFWGSPKPPSLPEMALLKGKLCIFDFINLQLTINGQNYSQMTPTVCEQSKMSLSLRLSLGYSPKKEQF